MTGYSGALPDWLAPRLAAAPPPLAEAVGGIVSAASSSDAGIPERLAAMALDQLDDITASPQTRGAALRLLAADALLTYAFEAAADPAIGGGCEAIDRLSREVGPSGRLGLRLEELL